MSISVPAQVVTAVRRVLGPVRRRIRRRFQPSLFKESYVNTACRGSGDAVYVEIGVRDGDSFRHIRASRKIGVDPEQTLKMRRLRRNEEFFKMTSDQFFEEEATLALGESMIDVALVDGLHEFEQTLRDVLNLERFMAPGGLIVLDDCNPRTRERAGDVVTGGAWNGDVWKVAAFLVNERPDLHYVTVDADEGIGLVNGFSGNHAFPTAETVAIYKKLDYSLLDEKRDQVLNLIPPTSVPRFL